MEPFEENFNAEPFDYNAVDEGGKQVLQMNFDAILEQNDCQKFADAYEKLRRHETYFSPYFGDNLQEIQTLIQRATNTQCVARSMPPSGVCPKPLESSHYGPPTNQFRQDKRWREKLCLHQYANNPILWNCCRNAVYDQKPAVGRKNRSLR